MTEPDLQLLAVRNSILAGRVVPFLGAGANLCGADAEPWLAGQGTRLPSGKELSVHIANLFSYRDRESDELKTDLAKVAQYAETTSGRGALDEQLQPLFEPLFPATSLHRFLAELPARCHAAGIPKTRDPVRKRFLIVTTNYDDVLERAFRTARKAVHVLTYLSNQDMPLFVHQPPTGPSKPIMSGNNYEELDRDTHPVILKVHGSVDRDRSEDKKGENFVITEDDYIDYLSFGDIASALPADLNAQLNESNFLFLGYALQDWNLRAFLKRIWREQKKKNFKSWAVMKDCSDFEHQYWTENKVQIQRTDLEHYIARLDNLLIEAGI